MRQLSPTKAELVYANMYARRFLLTNVSVRIEWVNGVRTAYLIGSDYDGIIYRIRYDKVRKMKKPDGNQILNKLDRFLLQAEEIHQDCEYDYSNIKEEDLAYLNKFEVVCNKKGHGSFYTHRSRFIEDEKGCPKCGIERAKKKRRKRYEETF